MKIRCEIIKDLLPLYCDKLTSEVSSEAVEEHFKECSDCKAVYESMKNESGAVIPDTDIEPLKKVRKKNKLKIISGFASGVVLLGILFVFLYVGVVPASSKDVSVTYSGKVLDDGSLSIDFELSTDNFYHLGLRGKQYVICSDENPSVIAYTQHIDTFYRVLKLPFDDLGENPGSYSRGFSTKQFNDGDVYIINFRDGEVIYDLKQLAEELGLQ